MLGGHDRNLSSAVDIHSAILLHNHLRRFRYHTKGICTKSNHGNPCKACKLATSRLNPKTTVREPKPRKHGLCGLAVVTYCTGLGPRRPYLKSQNLNEPECQSAASPHRSNPTLTDKPTVSLIPTRQASSPSPRSHIGHIATNLQFTGLPVCQLKQR